MGPCPILDSRRCSIITTMYVTIFVFVDLLFVADINGAIAFEVKSLEIGTSGTIPCDNLENDPEVRVVQWYKSRRIDVFENGDHSLASWVNGSISSLSNYHMEDNTLSLVFDMATLDDEGLYKCFVARGDLFTESNYYIRTVMYALPRIHPLITMDTDLNRVNCTVEHVRPLIYPVFDFDSSPDSIETYAVLNKDGTYTTSVTCSLPRSKSVSRVECSFIYLHYQRVGSFDLHDITTDSPMEYKTITGSPLWTSVTFAGGRCIAIDQTVIIVVGIVIGLLTVSNFIMLICLIKARKKCKRGVHNSNRAKKSKENMMEPEVMAILQRSSNLDTSFLEGRN